MNPNVRGACITINPNVRGACITMNPNVRGACITMNPNVRGACICRILVVYYRTTSIYFIHMVRVDYFVI